MRAMRTIKKTNPGAVSAKDDAAKPRRAGVRTAQKPDRGPVKTVAEKPRRAADKMTAKPRNTASKAPAKPNSRNAAVQTSAAKPRRVGTKLTRLLSLNVAPARPAAQTNASKPRHTGTATLTQWLLYCRSGFEQDCAQEALRQARQHKPVIAEQPDIINDSGYAVVALNEQALSFRELIFARQLIRLHHSIAALPDRDRLTPILNAITALPGDFGTLWLEVPDTNDGKTLSAFVRRFQPLLETALREQGRLLDDVKLPRLHMFFPDKASVLIGSSDPYNSSPALMGITRQSIPAEAPSRSTLKLAEAIETFMDKSEQTRLLRTGMTAVDLGAAPGGWTWQMVSRGIRVTAVDNGPMKGVLAKHPLVEHLRQDGFKFAPRKAVDWLICDMVEKPAKVAELIGAWFVAGWCRNAIFNLKLPMKQRVIALDAALGGIRARLEEEGISYKLMAKQLYHDREEITVFLTKTKNR
jgi:23S rRNA (cytidine2498-2'-O)-methyltransferase